MHAPPLGTSNSADDEHWKRAWQAFHANQIAECDTHLKFLSASASHAPVVVTLRALVLIRQGQSTSAEQLLQSLVERGAADAATYVNLGELQRQGGRLPAAKSTLERAVTMAPQMAQAHYNLGAVLSQMGDDVAAIACYQTALSLQPNYTRARFNLANSLRREGRCYPALDHFRQLVRQQPQWAEAWQNLGATEAEVGESEAALESLRRAGELSPRIQADSRASIAGVLLAMDRVAEATEQFRAAATPGRKGDWQRLQADLICAAVPDSVQDIDDSRKRAEVCLRRSVQELATPDSSETSADWFEPPMQWAYHGRDDRVLKTLFAELYLSRIAPLELRPRTGCARAGFVVTHGHEGVFARCLGAILTRLATTELQVSIICTRATANTLRFFAPELAPLVLETPSDVQKAAEFLVEQQFDLLYYWEIGTDAFNYLLPFWKPALVQCSSWGWPITSGNPRVDAFLTNRAIEPSDAEDHYTERCYWLDGPLTIYPRPAPLAPRQRERFGFTECDRVYVCQQNLRKWHPDFDGLLQKILASDDRGVFAFIGHTQPTITQKLLARLGRTIDDVKRRTRIFPFQDRAEYLELIRAADVALDTPHYGGGANTLADAFAVGTPVVTWEGPFHRGRFAAAMLRQAGADDIVASSPEEYVENALRIAAQPDFRRSVSQKLSDAYSEVFENPRAADVLRDALLTMIAAGRAAATH